MSLDELKAEHKIIGTKQVRKALSKGNVMKVYIAADAEPYITTPIKEACNQENIEVEVVNNMKTLGYACGIDVGSAVAAILRE